MKWDIMNVLLGLSIQMISDHRKEHLYIIVDSTPTAITTSAPAISYLTFWHAASEVFPISHLLRTYEKCCIGTTGTMHLYKDTNRLRDQYIQFF